MLEMMKENVEDLFTPGLWLALPAEMIGTLVITLLGCGSLVPWMSGTQDNGSLHGDHTGTQDGIVRVSLTFGLAVATMVWVFSHTSGGYFNPAVTTAALFTRRLSIIRGLLYIVSQIVGAIVGAGILYGLTPYNGEGNLGANQLHPGITPAQGFGVEMMITVVLVLAYCSSLDEKRTDLKGSAPLTIGLAVVACHLFAVPITRTGMNPARSFGPAVVLGVWDDHWVFWVGPMVGAVVTGLIYEYIFAAGATFAGVTKCLLRTKKPRQSRQAEPEKAPLEEVKTDVIEIDESKSEEKVENGEGGMAEVELSENSKTVVEEVSEKA